MTYDFLAIDEGKQNLLKGNTETGIQWIVDLQDYPKARAMERIDDKTVLIGYDRGFFTVDPDKGEILENCGRWNDVTSAYRGENDSVWITVLNYEGRKGIWHLRLDSDRKIIEEKTMKGSYVRLVTPTEKKTLLLSVNNRILETDGDLNPLREFKAKGFKHAWKATILKDERVLISGGYGAFMAFFSSDGELLKKFGGKGAVPKEVKPYFYANYSFTHDGNILAANWQGHGPRRGKKGRQLVCFSPEGEYLASWSFSEEISSLQGILTL